MVSAVLLVELIFFEIKLRNKFSSYRRAVENGCLTVIFLLSVFSAMRSNSFSMIIRSALIFFVLFSIYCIILKRSKKLSRRKELSLLLLVYLATCILSSIPMERPYLRFDSPQKAFGYEYNTNSLIKMVEADDMAVAIYHNEDSTSFALLEKDGRGWMMSGSNSNGIQLGGFFNNASIVTAESSLHSEMMVFVQEVFTPLLPDNTVNTEVHDSRGSTFHKFSFPLNQGTDRYTYAVISTPITDYSITVNGKSALLSELLSKQASIFHSLNLGLLLLVASIILLVLCLRFYQRILFYIKLWFNQRRIK